MLQVLMTLAAFGAASSSGVQLKLVVDCDAGTDVGPGTEAQPFRTVQQAQAALRRLRATTSTSTIAHTAATITISGLCELESTLEVGPADSNTVFLGKPGALLSGGTQIAVPAASAAIVHVDLARYNFSSSSLGKLRGRGYSGGSACILLNNYENSPAELHYRPAGPASSAGARSFGAQEVGRMRLARWPNVEAAAPSASDWTKITKVTTDAGITLITLRGVNSTQLRTWAAEAAAGVDVWTHGLWSWNWADSHRPVTAIAPNTGTITVGKDDIDRDVDPIKTGRGPQGGNVYVYNLKSELDAPGEYFIDRTSATLSFIPSRAAQKGAPSSSCQWNVSISRSDQSASRVWKSYVIEARHDETFRFDGCSSAGPMGQTCAHMPKPNGPVVSGARTLIVSNGTVVGEGVCCNAVSDAVVSATRLSCSNPTPTPPAPAPPAGTYHVSRLAGVVSVMAAANVTFQNLEIRHGRGAGVVVNGSTGVVVRGCTVADHGTIAINITGGSGNVVLDSDVHGSGDTGIALDGGDRISLTPSNHAVKNCTVHHNQRWIMNYAPNLFVGGVGGTVEDTEIFGSPQIAVFFQGNDHTINRCDIHDVGRECSDCGAFYAGRDWTYRGNVIEGTRFSKLESIWGARPSAVYLDDQLSSVAVRGCTFDHITGSLLELGGGRNNEFSGNIINGSSSLHFDNRGGDGSGCAQGAKVPFAFLQRVPYKSAAWGKYPDMANILDDAPCTPKHNTFENNVLCGSDTTLSGVTGLSAAKWGSVYKNNSVRSCSL